ncbi:hypothetical protein BDW68DRAFT_153811 [Aspergillus falconensis]
MLEGLVVVEQYGESIHLLSEVMRSLILKGTNRYCSQLKEDYIGYLLSEDQAIYINFFDWMHWTSQQKALQSYNEY